MRFEDHNINDLLASLEAEVAKQLNEIRFAQEDLIKVENRCRFNLALIHHLKKTYGDIK